MESETGSVVDYNYMVGNKFAGYGLSSPGYQCKPWAPRDDATIRRQRECWFSKRWLSRVYQSCHTVPQLVECSAC